MKEMLCIIICGASLYSTNSLTLSVRFSFTPVACSLIPFCPSKGLPLKNKKAKKRSNGYKGSTHDGRTR